MPAAHEGCTERDLSRLGALLLHPNLLKGRFTLVCTELGPHVWRIGPPGMKPASAARRLTAINTRRELGSNTAVVRLTVTRALTAHRHYAQLGALGSNTAVVCLTAMQALVAHSGTNAIIETALLATLLLQILQFFSLLLFNLASIAILAAQGAI